MRSDLHVTRKAETLVMRSRDLRTQCRSLVARAKTLVRNGVPRHQAAVNRQSIVGSSDYPWKAQIKALSERVVSAREDERRRIARNIHDQLGQQITALRMNVEELQNRPRQNAWLIDRTKRISRLAEELDKSMDLLVSELRPPVLEDSGLSDAMQDLVATWSDDCGISARFRARGVQLGSLPRELELNLYRVAQEALHNVHKHASASHVVVTLERRGPDIVLIVEDNGMGFDPLERNRRHGLGLISMQERAATVGGQLEIDSEVGGGTFVSIRVPIEATATP